MDSLTLIHEYEPNDTISITYSGYDSSIDSTAEVVEETELLENQDAKSDENT